MAICYNGGMKKILNYSILAGLFLIPFLAFFVPSSMFFPFISGRGFAFRIIVEIIFGLYVILAFLDSEYRPKMSWLTKSILFFTAAILISDILGANPYKSLWSNYERMEGFVLIAHLVAYYFVASAVLTKQKWNWLFNTTIFASLAMSFYGLFQLLGVAAINQGGVRVDGTLGNATYLAIYLVFHIFLGIYMIVGSNIKWQKWGYGIVAVFELVILYYSATRGAILGLIGGLFLTGLLLAWKERENKTLRRVAFGIIGIFILLVGGFIAMRNSSLVKQNPVLSRFSTLGIAEFKTQGRYFVWPMAIKGFMERPILGWGQENFNFVFNKYYNPGLFEQEEWFDRTHDIFLDWLIAGGIVGFLAYASMYFAFFYYLWRRTSPLTYSQKSVLTGMFVAYIFHNIFVFDNLISYIMFFTFIAFMHSISTTEKKIDSTYSSKTFNPDISNYIIAPVVVILTIATIYFVNVPALQANRTLIQALTPQADGNAEKNLELFHKVFDYNSFGNTEAVEHLAQLTSQIQGSEAPDALKQKFYEYSKEKILEKVAQTPNDARYLVFAGSFFNRFGQYDEAIKYLSRALVESPNKQSIYFEIGTSYLGKGDTAKAFEMFKKAYELKPDSLESKIIYTIGAIYTKNAKVLQQMAGQISEDIIIRDNRFITAYANIGDYGSVINILLARIQKDPTNTQLRLDLASTYMAVGRKQEAINIIQQLIKEHPEFKAQGEEYIRQIQNS